MIRTEHREAEWKFPFVTYTPEKMHEKMPVIIQLHGAGERGNGVGSELDKVDVHGLSKVIKDKEIDCIFVMPQCPAESFWAARVESILEFIEQIKNKYDIDEDRVCLTGLSMGGFGTWYTAMAKPSLFAAIAPICGGGMAWNAGALTMPIWAFHGAEDETVSVNQSDEMVESLKKCGADVTYTRFDGVGHNAWEPAYTDELINWLLSKKRG